MNITFRRLNLDTTVNFTKTQQLIMSVLEDGMAHSKAELLAVMDDELTFNSTIKVHISNIRKKLEPHGQMIICEYNNRRAYYRWVRRLGNPYDGQR